MSIGRHPETTFFGVSYNLEMAFSKTAHSVPSVASLANQFSQLMRSTLTAGQMDQVVAGNRTEIHPNVCHSGDFCDSNMVLHQVFMRYGMDLADDGGAERWGHLWDAAWDLAKMRGFTMFKRGDIVEMLDGFQDMENGTLTWVIQSDEENGQVDLVPLEAVGALEPMYAVKVGWIRLKLPQAH